LLRPHNLLHLLALFAINLLSAQLNPALVGDAISEGSNCFIITQDILNQSGGVWFDNPIDFDEDFTIYYQNNFGTKDSDGADGMALVFKTTPNPELGNSGGGLGYQGISPSLVVEFDTYQNNIPSEGLLDDPSFDHIAILRDGDPFHTNATNNLAGPVQASGSSINIEDGAPHDIKIVWMAASKNFEVYFDCELRLSLNFDIEADIFNGSERIFFGFVGSTGGLSNIHQVCFNSISFVDNLQLSDQVVCDGESVSIDASVPSGVSYSWSPTVGVSDPNSANPVFSPTSTTTYTVIIQDLCGESITEDITLTVLPLINPEFDPVAPVCFGEPQTPLPMVSNNGISGSWSPPFNNTETTNYTFIPDEGQCAFTVNLEIEVIPNIVPEFDPVGPICPGDELMDLPEISNNGITGQWSPALNNTVTTVYTFLPDPGQGCVVQSTLEIVVFDPVIPEFQQRDPICTGEALDPLETTSLNGITGSWSPELTNEETIVYTFTPDPGQCTNVQVELEIVVIPISEISVSVQLISEPFSAQQSVEVNVTGGTGVYEYSLDGVTWQLSNVFEDINGCNEFQVRAREVTGCSNVAVASFRVFDYPRFFTPNGDASNDFWNIKCLQEQQGVVIEIYDRYGRFLQTISPLSSGWDGRYNGDLMPANDYWFKVNYSDGEGNPRVLMSHFALRR